ncbi:unnamed protein product [Brassicogethes aeneus]|uniref:Glycosyl hydrolases family 39 N-terminal catalytic domain-containing protein n=1 Tax=Brassicogethes aeneus TaxID=1431903 RepID=A0A9P0BAR7_BRAAE|nr:unnamed protein product [Brassicogethes aeneus]
MYRYVKALIPMLLIIQPIYNYNYNRNQLQIRFNANRTRGAFHRFWRSTGLCPLDPKTDAYKFLLSQDEKINLVLIGSLPNKGIRHVRIHWLLNLIQESEHDGQYNFTYLDNLIDHLTEYNLRPGFEIMGNPISSKPFNVTYKSNINWTRIVQQISLRYIDKYGIKEVKKWKFETWNEPDLKSYNSLNFTLPEYLTYVQETSKGLQKAFASKKSIGKLGGPAGLFKDKHHHPLCWGVLEICGKNNTSAKCPFQFLSFHKKGDSSAEGLMNVTLSFLDEISERYPGLKSIPIANDEADLLANWSKSEEWRADVRYAANVLKVIAGYYKSVELDRKWKIEALSNDNAFLNYHPYYFTQRTLFSRFQMNETTPPHVQFIKKPVYSVMGMLSFLKGERLVKKDKINQDPILTILATKNGNKKYLIN